MTELLQINQLSVYFPLLTHKVLAVDNISFSLKPKETLGIIGKSGSGKTSLALAILRLLNKAEISGSIFYKEKDLLRLQKLAKIHKATLVTTRKDLVKIPAHWHVHLYALDISVQFEDAEGIYRFILEKTPFLKEVA